MKIGILKSKIETLLTESMSNNTFKKEILKFKNLVLEDKNIAKSFYLYDTIDNKKGLTQDEAHEFVNECVRQFEKIKLDSNKIKTLQKWVTGIESKNLYEDIDTIFDETILIESIIKSKKNLISKMTQKEKKSEVVNVPLQQVYEVASKTTKDYLSNLSEEDLKTLNKYLTLTESEIVSKYDLLSEMTIEKLRPMINESDKETKEKINSVIDRISNEPKNQMSLMKLRQLYNSL
jgi:hypothetical protein